jgi:hypothetical protein
MTADNGGAPCVYNGLLSLAICKPEIRKKARAGDIIIGIGSKKQYGERLMYMAIVTQRLELAEFYEGRYSKRPDCIYEKDLLGAPILRKNAKYHTKSDQREHDVGMDFGRAFVLLSSDFRYFGKAGTDDYKREFPQIKGLVEGFGRGHRVNFSPALWEELVQLKVRLWKEFPSKMKIGEASESDCSRLCNEDAGSSEVGIVK